MNNQNLTTFYIVRHGETDWNVKKIVQGQEDIPLNQTGEKQAEDLAKVLQNIRFDKIFTSDLIRAKKTAEIIALERKLAVETTNLLRARQLGKFSGQPAEVLITLTEEYNKLSQNEKKEYSAKHNIEAPEDMISRVITFIREVSLAYAGKTILIVTHGETMRVLLRHLGFFDSKLHTGTIENTSYIKLLSDGVDFFIKETKGINKGGQVTD